MDQDNGHLEIIYQRVMRAAYRMFQSGGLTKEEYLRFEKNMQEKYSPIIGVLFSDIDLLSCGS